MLQKAMLVLFAASGVWWWATAPGTKAKAPRESYVLYEIHADGTLGAVR